MEESGGDVKKSCGTKLCELQEKIPIAFVLGGAVIGIALGIGFTYWNPDDPSTKEVVIMWIGLIGDLFIHALKCIIMPLVFVSITISHGHALAWRGGHNNSLDHRIVRPYYSPGHRHKLHHECDLQTLLHFSGFGCG